MLILMSISTTYYILITFYTLYLFIMYYMYLCFRRQSSKYGNGILILDVLLMKKKFHLPSHLLSSQKDNIKNPHNDGLQY